MSPVITVENLSKKYIIGHQKQEGYTTLRDVLANGARRLNHELRHPFAAPENDPTHEEFWALKDVNFDIQQGDRVGIARANFIIHEYFSGGLNHILNWPFSVELYCCPMPFKLALAEKGRK
jgi:hypothetical protein